jgi:hypothetical protein
MYRVKLVVICVTSQLCHLGNLQAEAKPLTAYVQPPTLPKCGGGLHSRPGEFFTRVGSGGHAWLRAAEVGWGTA